MILYYKITISTIVFNNSTIFKTDSNNNIIPFWKELNSEIVKVKESLATDIFKDFNNGVSIDVLQQKYTNLDNSLVQYLNQVVSFMQETCHDAVVSGDIINYPYYSFTSL